MQAMRSKDQAHPKYPNALAKWMRIRRCKAQRVAENTSIPLRTLWEYIGERAAIEPDRLEQLAAYLQCRPGQLLSKAPPLWNVPYQRNHYFTGRKDLLERLHDSLGKANAGAIAPQALCGLGGIGKTQTVLEYAYRFGDEYQAVFWVKADCRENLFPDVLSIAEALDLPERKAQHRAATVAAINRWLREQEGWLLIFDNADDLALAREFIPSGYRGHILLTTRAQSTGRLAHRIEVENMSPETGALFLLRRAGMLDPDAPLDGVPEEVLDLACELVRQLGGLPLALDQAAAYMEESPYSLAGYLRLYHKERLALLKRRGGLIEDHPAPVATTWSISFEEVEHVDPTAADLLRLCAFLDPDAIPEELLRKGATALGPALAAAASDDLAINRTIEALWRYSLVGRHTDSQMLSMHRLVQIVLKETMDLESQRLWAERVVRALQLAFPTHVEPGCWDACQRLLPQAQACSSLIEQYSIADAGAAQALNQVAYYLRERAWYTEAETFYRQAFTMRDLVLGTDHLDTAHSAYNLARLYFDQARYEEAERLFLRALAIREHALGQEHPDIAQCMNALALLYWFWGKYAEAEPLYQRALPMRVRLLGLEHPDTAHCMNNLALLYVTQGRYAEAEQLHTKVLAIRERVLAPDHPDTAQSLQNLACLYVAQGDSARYAEAEQLLRRSLLVREKVLGLEHPQTAKSLHNLALLFEAQGRYAEAEQLYQRTLAIRVKTLGADNPKTGAARGDYAALLRKTGREHEAAQLEAHRLPEHY